MAKSKPKSKRGGTRAGAGRKPNPTNEIRREIVRDRTDVLSEAQEAIVAFLPRGIANLIILANGGFQRVEDKYEVQPSIMIGPPDKQVATEAKLVLTERTVSVAEPDRAANQYLIDRVFGRPTQSMEVSGPGGKPVNLSFEAAAELIYGDKPAVAEQ